MEVNKSDNFLSSHQRLHCVSASNVCLSEVKYTLLHEKCPQQASCSDDESEDLYYQSVIINDSNDQCSSFLIGPVGSINIAEC